MRCHKQLPGAVPESARTHCPTWKCSAGGSGGTTAQSGLADSMRHTCTCMAILRMQDACVQRQDYDAAASSLEGAHLLACSAERTRPWGLGSGVSIAPACRAMAVLSAGYTGTTLRPSRVRGFADHASSCLSVYLRVDELGPAAVVQPQRAAAPASGRLPLMQQQ